MSKLKIKKGDIVKVIAGESKGKQGRVLEVFPETNRASVENVISFLNIHAQMHKILKVAL